MRSLRCYITLCIMRNAYMQVFDSLCYLVHIHHRARMYYVLCYVHDSRRDRMYNLVQMC